MTTFHLQTSGGVQSDATAALAGYAVPHTMTIIKLWLHVK